MSSSPRRSLATRATAVAAVALAAVVLASPSASWATDLSNTVGSVDATVGAVATIDTPRALPVRVSVVDAQLAVDYWTPERMMAATQAGDPVAPGAPANSADDSSAARTVNTASSDTAPSTELTSASGSVAQQVAPVPHIGRVFYTLNGADYICSANVVQSANRSTVATAAHCMTGNGAFSENSVFVPAYENGDAPYGRWPVVAGEIAGGFTENNADQADDAGFLVVAHNDDGADITSVVGASPVLFNQPLSQEGSVFGYPAAGRFNGETLQTCSGQFEALGSQQIDLACDMNEGVSGGPIFEGDSADGAQYANEDARFEDYSHILGPIWQDNEESAYDLAAATAVDTAESAQ
ncbi:serine protease [Agreia sp. COWG]|uniref:trypsin-like serine peptidase n=1 Tax=Agreia sp. COWG TaxID=2773266 RepID=UPI0019280384|nr:serine protease [Agreia sp. COWG]CAD5989940.1 conserved exported protein of unknown function [Agreia sp. COWG]